MINKHNKFSFLIIGLFAFFVFGVGQAGAVEINLPGRTVDVDSSGGNSSAQIQYDGGATLEAEKTTTQSGTTVNVTRTTPTSVQSNTSVRVNVSGKSVLVSSDKDLDTLKKEVVTNCSVVTEINTDGDLVRVSYNQPARLFGIFRSNLNANVEVSEDGKVEVKLPWYNFLFTKTSGAIETKIQGDVNVKLDGINLGLQRKALAIELVNSALALEVAPCSSSTKANNVDAKSTTSKTETKTTSQTSTQTNTATKTATTNTTVKASVTLPDFKGEWNGSYSPNSLTSEDCKPGGETSLTIDNNGGVVGYIVFRGEKGFGTGKVDANGNLNGSWNYSGLAISFSGKINGNTGNGTYQNSLGCFGTFSISR